MTGRCVIISDNILRIIRDNSCSHANNHKHQAKQAIIDEQTKQETTILDTQAKIPNESNNMWLGKCMNYAQCLLVVSGEFLDQ